MRERNGRANDERADAAVSGLEPDSLEVYLLGIVDFDSALTLQERFHAEVAWRTDGSGVLLVAEHPPLVTIGRDGRSTDLADTPQELKRQHGVGVRWVSRGGGTVVHGPGQLAVYCILPLKRLNVGLAEFRRRLETVLVETVEQVRVPAVNTRAGVAVRGKDGKNKMVGWVGAAVSDGVSRFGLFLNVGPDLFLTRRLLADRVGSAVTSLESERQLRTLMHTVRQTLVERLAERFSYHRWHVYSGHPLLKRVRKPIREFV